MAGDTMTAKSLCKLYTSRVVSSKGGHTTGGVPFDIRGAAYIVAVAKPGGLDSGCSLGTSADAPEA